MTWDPVDLALWREYCALVYDDTTEPQAATNEPAQSWRDLPVTIRQEKLLKKFAKKAATRGEAADLIRDLPPRIR